MLHVPYTGFSLRFTTPWPGISSTIWLVLLLCIFLVMLAVGRKLLRWEISQLPSPWNKTLLAFRLVLLGSLLALLLLDPTIVSTSTSMIPGRVLVALDCSDSMRIADAHRSVGDKLRLARRLKIAGDLASDNELETWAAASSGEPKRFLSDGERARFQAVLKRVNNLTRLDLAHRVLVPEGLNLLALLREHHQVELIGMGTEITPLPAAADALAHALAQRTQPAEEVIATDLKLPLQYASRQRAEAASDLLGIILLSDGRHNVGASPLDAARELAQHRVGIWPIYAAANLAPPDVAIASARAANSTVFLGSTVPIEATIRAANWPAGTIRASLHRVDTEELLAEDIIEHSGGDGLHQISMKVTIREPGVQLLELRALGTGEESYTQNNRRILRLNAVKDQARVLLVDGEARWEFHYVHTCLGRDPNMEMRSVVFRMPRIKQLKADEARLMGLPAEQLPSSTAALSTYDVVILGDVEPNQMSLDERQRIERYVADAGGTLVISAGKRAMPLEYENADEPFRRLLPLTNPRILQREEGFQLDRTVAGRRSWFLELGGTDAGAVFPWRNLPPHYWAVTGTPKDGAEVLVAGPQGEPVIVRQNYGFGRVLFIGIDSTWRWRFKRGDVLHHRFWGQLAQWAASDRLLPVTNAAGTIRFGVREPTFEAGQDVEVAVRISDSLPPGQAGDTANVRVIRLPTAASGTERLAAMVPLQSIPERPRDFKAVVTDLPPGSYALELDIPRVASELAGPPGPDGRAGPLRCAFQVVPSSKDEMLNLAGDPALLEELAKASGGRMVSLENAASIVEEISTRTATQTMTKDYPLRRAGPLLALLVLLLAVEWIVRKWFGLP